MLANNNRLAQQLIQEENHVSHHGSIHGHAVIHREREKAHRNLFNDYFADNPLYGEREFNRRFRMSKRLFLHIVEAVKIHDNYFNQRRAASSRMGLSTLQKVTAAFSDLGVWYAC